jgi:hypothetical protein
MGREKRNQIGDHAWLVQYENERLGNYNGQNTTLISSKFDLNGLSWLSQGSVSNILREWKEGKNQTTNEIASSETDISTTQWHGEGVASSPINITDDVRNSEPDVDFSDFSYQEILM